MSLCVVCRKPAVARVTLATFRVPEWNPLCDAHRLEHQCHYGQLHREEPTMKSNTERVLEDLHEHPWSASVAVAARVGLRARVVSGTLSALATRDNLQRAETENGTARYAHPGVPVPRGLQLASAKRPKAEAPVPPRDGAPQPEAPELDRIRVELATARAQAADQAEAMRSEMADAQRQLVATRAELVEALGVLEKVGVQVGRETSTPADWREVPGLVERALTEASDRVERMRVRNDWLETRLARAAALLESTGTQLVAQLVAQVRP